MDTIRGKGTKERTHSICFMWRFCFCLKSVSPVTQGWLSSSWVADHLEFLNLFPYPLKCCDYNSAPIFLYEFAYEHVCIYKCVCVLDVHSYGDHRLSSDIFSHSFPKAYFSYQTYLYILVSMYMCKFRHAIVCTWKSKQLSEIWSSPSFMSQELNSGCQIWHQILEPIHEVQHFFFTI